MKKILFVSIITLLLAVSFNAYSADSTYFGVNLGMATVEEDNADIDSGILGSISYGAVFDQYRAEGELFYQSNDWAFMDENDTAKTWGVLANGYYDFNTDSAWTPYVGIGIGYAKVDFGPDDDSGLVYQGSVGVSYDFNENTSLDIRYRYYDVDIDDVDFNGHSGLVGIRFKF